MKSWIMDHACIYSLGQICFLLGEGGGFTVSPRGKSWDMRQIYNDTADKVDDMIDYSRGYE